MVSSGLWHNQYESRSEEPIYNTIPQEPTYYVPNIVQQSNSMGLIFPCHNCDKMYRHYGSLTRHLKLECGVEPQYPCPFCPRRVTRKSDLKKHIKRLHPLVDTNFTK